MSAGITSLRGRLTAWLLLGITLTLGLCGAVVHASIARRLRGDFDAALASQAESLMTLTSQDRNGVRLDFADEEMPQFSSRLRPWYFQLLDTNGAVIERSVSLHGRPLPYARTPFQRPLLRDQTLPDGRPGRLMSITFRPQAANAEKQPEGAAAEAAPATPGASPGLVTLTVARGREELLAALKVMSWTLFSALALTLLGTAAVIAVSLRLGLSPLAELARQLQRLDAGTLGQRMEVDDLPAELAPVVEHINDLLRRLRVSFERERSFSANVAHELRTPISELRTLSEVAMRWPDRAEVREEFFQDVHGIGLQMERVVANLFALARFESGQQAVDASSFRLRDAVLEGWREVESAVRTRATSLEVEIPPELALTTDRAKLQLILANLLSNAVAYSPDGAVIRCTAAGGDRRFSLALSNPIPAPSPGQAPTRALAAEDLPKLFDRFWRKDPARSGEAHSGLGLALVAALCDLLRLRYQAFLEAGVFTIQLEGARVIDTTSA